MFATSVAPHSLTIQRNRLRSHDHVKTVDGTNTVRVFLIAPEATALLRLYPITLSRWCIQDHLGPLRQQLPGPMRKLTATNQKLSTVTQGRPNTDRPAAFCPLSYARGAQQRRRRRVVRRRQNACRWIRRPQQFSFSSISCRRLPPPLRPLSRRPFIT